MNNVERIDRLDDILESLWTQVWGAAYPAIGNGGIVRDVCDLKRRHNPVEKDCPVCGHVTLMKREEAPWGPWTYTCTDKGMACTDDGTKFYCYTCGKTFKEEEKKALVEIPPMD